MAEADGYDEADTSMMNDIVLRKHASPFIMKLWSLLEEPRYREYIAWSVDGLCLEILDQRRFSKEVLPQLFKTNQFASFVRQLHLYGFQKRGEVNADQPLYMHSLFNKEASLAQLARITRRKKNSEPGHQGSRAQYVPYGPYASYAPQQPYALEDATGLPASDNATAAGMDAAAGTAGGSSLAAAAVAGPAGSSNVLLPGGTSLLSEVARIEIRMTGIEKAFQSISRNASEQLNSRLSESMRASAALSQITRVLEERCAVLTQLLFDVAAAAGVEILEVPSADAVAAASAASVAPSAGSECAAGTFGKEGVPLMPSELSLLPSRSVSQPSSLQELSQRPVHLELGRTGVTISVRPKAGGSVASAAVGAACSADSSRTMTAATLHSLLEGVPAPPPTPSGLPPPPAPTPLVRGISTYSSSFYQPNAAALHHANPAAVGSFPASAVTLGNIGPAPQKGRGGSAVRGGRARSAAAQSRPPAAAPTLLSAGSLSMEDEEGAGQADEAEEEGGEEDGGALDGAAALASAAASVAETGSSADFDQSTLPPPAALAGGKRGRGAVGAYPLSDESGTDVSPAATLLAKLAKGGSAGGVRASSEVVKHRSSARLGGGGTLRVQPTAAAAPPRKAADAGGAARSATGSLAALKASIDEPVPEPHSSSSGMRRGRGQRRGSAGNAGPSEAGDMPPAPPILRPELSMERRPSGSSVGSGGPGGLTRTLSGSQQLRDDPRLLPLVGSAYLDDVDRATQPRATAAAAAGGAALSTTSDPYAAKTFRARAESQHRQLSEATDAMLSLASDQAPPPLSLSQSVSSFSGSGGGVPPPLLSGAAPPPISLLREMSMSSVAL